VFENRNSRGKPPWRDRTALLVLIVNSLDDERKNHRPTKEKIMNCPKCNKPVPANARFCGACGQHIEAAPDAPAPSAAPTLAGAHASAGASAAAGAASAAASKAWAAAAASAPGLLARIKNIVLTPKTEWLVIAPESTPVAQLFMGYVAPLAVLAALIGFVRMSVIGVNTAFGGGCLSLRSLSTDSRRHFPASAISARRSKCLRTVSRRRC